MSGIERIAAERQRQIEQEGWTPKHDDEHNDESLASAAAAYAIAGVYRSAYGEDTSEPPSDWPWDDSWWKPLPDNRIRELEKAGALIAAEIDRLERLKA